MSLQQKSAKNVINNNNNTNNNGNNSNANNNGSSTAISSSSSSTNLNGIGNTDNYPKYEVIQKLDNNIEIRKYEPAKWACTTSKIILNDTDTNSHGYMFRRLFDYICGRNETNEKIQMTVPVIINYKSLNNCKIDSNSECIIQMGLLMPKEVDNIKIPNPLSESVCVKADPIMTFACIEFDGYATLDDNLRHRDELIESLGDEAENYDCINFITASYDPPLKTLNRRNEIWLRKTK